MGNEVNADLVYALADALFMRIECSRGGSMLTGEVEMPVDIGGLTVPFNLKIVGSLVHKHTHMIMARVKGNLALLAVATTGAQRRSVVKVHLLNIAKMGRYDTWIDFYKPKNEKEAVKLLGKAVVASFAKNGMMPFEAA